MQSEHEEQEAPPRAGALVAVGSVALAALLVAGGVLAFIRASAGSTDGPSTVAAEEEVPDTFPGGFEPGEVPGPVAAAVDRPVVAVVALAELPPGLEGCAWGALEDRELEWAMAGPDGILLGETGLERFEAFPDEELRDDVVVEMELEARPVPPDGDFAPEPQRMRYECLAQEQDGGWITDAVNAQPVELMDEHGTSVSCCDRQGLATAVATVRTQPEAAFVLQDRGGYWLAHPVAGRERVVVSWRFPEGRFGVRGTTHVLLVDDAGQVIDERFVGG